MLITPNFCIKMTLWLSELCVSPLQARSTLVGAIDAVPLTSPGFMMQVNELMIYLLYVPQEITLSALVSEHWSNRSRLTDEIYISSYFSLV